MDHVHPSVHDRLFGAAMIIAPVLLLASTIAAVLGEGLGEDQAGGVLQMYAAAAFFLAIIGLTRLIEATAPRAAAALTVFGAFGVAGAAGYAINSIYAAIGPVNLNENVDGSAGQLALQTPGILFPLTFIGIGIFLLRGHVEPRWSGIALILGGVLFPVSRIGSIDALAPVPDALLLIGLVPLGLALLKGRAPATTTSGTTQPAY